MTDVFLGVGSSEPPDRYEGHWKAHPAPNDAKQPNDMWLDQVRFGFLTLFFTFISFSSQITHLFLAFLAHRMAVSSTLCIGSCSSRASLPPQVRFKRVFSGEFLSHCLRFFGARFRSILLPLWGDLSGHLSNDRTAGLKIDYLMKRGHLLEFFPLHEKDKRDHLKE